MRGTAIIELLFLALILGIIPAMIARSQGRNFAPWYVYSVVVFVIALVHSILLRPNQDEVERRQLADECRKKCPFCAELIKVEARVCRYCGRDVALKGEASVNAVTDAGWEELRSRTGQK